MLEPLAVMARVLADRQEWSQLEQAYRRMLERVERIPKGGVRTEVTWELCRRLGVLFREHLEDPSLALDAFEDAVHEKPGDLPTRLTAADLARSIGKHDRAAIHLEVAASLDPGRVATFHELFEVFQKLRRPDQAYEAACVTMFVRQADARERFIFEEHKPEGVPKPSYVMPATGWDRLRVQGRDTYAEAVLAAAAPAAITLRLAQLASEGRLPSLDPAARQDPEKTTISIVRSFAWAAHLLGVPAPAVYLVDVREARPRPRCSPRSRPCSSATRCCAAARSRSSRSSSAGTSPTTWARTGCSCTTRRSRTCPRASSPPSRR